MRRNRFRLTALAAGGVALVLLRAGDSVGLTEPEPAPLPDYDIRTDAREPARGPLAPEAVRRFDGHEPERGYDSEQRSAVERLRRQSVPALHVGPPSRTGLPRTLHAAGAPLSQPSSAPLEEIARGFLRAYPELFRLGPEEVDALVVVRRTETSPWLRLVWLGQEVGGVGVDRGEIRFAVDREGRLRWVSAGDVVPGLSVTAPALLSPEQAVASAARAIGWDLASVPPRRSEAGGRRIAFEPGPFLSDVVVEPLVFPLGPQGGLLAWRVWLEPPGPTPAWYLVSVDARAGRLLGRTNLYRYATNQGLVFNGPYPATVAVPPFPPGHGVAQSTVSFGYRWPSTTGYTIPAPYGAYNESVGNNVDCREDWLRDNEITLGARADGGPAQEFLFPFLNAYETSLGATDPERVLDAQRDVNAAITNLFYWNNWWHDYMYALGFDEASGNFQHDNFSRGGCGGDPVLADAQDGAQPPGGGNPSLNNANFATPPETLRCPSTPPRMNMFLWRFTRPGPGLGVVPRDGDFDADIVIHEYSHGVSHRLVGGPSVGCVSGVQSGAMGEGWGDWYAASYFDSPVVAEYSTNNPVLGIRRYPMDGNPRTYADLCSPGCQVHQDGEIHASTLWDLRTAVGRRVAEQLVTDAMKLSPCGPSFLEYRDALVLADSLRYGGAHYCAIFGAYLPRGMGYDAQGRDTDFRIPDFLFDAPRCSGHAHLRYHAHTTRDSDGDGLYGAGETIALRVEIGNFEGASTATSVQATVSTATPGIRLTAATRDYGPIPAGAVGLPLVPFEFVVEPSYLCGTPIDFRVDIRWSPALARQDVFQDTGGSAPGVRLAGSDAEGALPPLAGPMGTSTAHNHTPGGGRSFYTLAGCYAGDDLGCSGPCNNTCSELSLPELTLPDRQASWFSFAASYNVEFLWDGVYLEVSQDGGATFSAVDTLNYPSWLPAGSIGCFPTRDLLAVNGPAQNDRLVPWGSVVGDLSAWAGKRVQLRLRSHQDWCLYFEGAYLDDIEVRARNCIARPFVSSYISGRRNDDTVNVLCTDRDGIPDPGEVVDLALTITNTGNLAARGLAGVFRSTSPSVQVLDGSKAFGDVQPGGSATATFRYLVVPVITACHEAVDLELDLTANGGAYAETLRYRETLRADTTAASWSDGFEGTAPAWTPSLGPGGTASDFNLVEINCVSSGSRRWFWATQRSVLPGVCSTGEPDYRADSDSLLTSPPIDLGAPGNQLKGLSWASFGVPNSVRAGFVEVGVDHDNDGIFTTVLHAEGGLGNPDPTTQRFSVDLQDNPLGAPLTGSETDRYVRVQFRFRSTGADPGTSLDSEGMLVDDFQLDWSLCDRIACLPGLRPVRGSGKGGGGGGTVAVPREAGVPTGPTPPGTPPPG